MYAPSAKFGTSLYLPILHFLFSMLLEQGFILMLSVIHIHLRKKLLKNIQRSIFITLVFPKIYKSVENIKIQIHYLL